LRVWPKSNDGDFEKKHTVKKAAIPRLANAAAL